MSTEAGTIQLRRRSQTQTSSADWAAIDAAAAQFQNNGFAGERRVIDIASDHPSDGGRCAPIRDAAVAAGITINESADPSVQRDILTTLRRLVPHQGDYRHAEGNSDAHVKTSLAPGSKVVMRYLEGLSAGCRLLGTTPSDAVPFDRELPGQA